MDNRNIVPYPPCHINMEYYAIIQCLKYIFKYITKVHDVVTTDVENEFDEILQYQTQRYVSSCESY